MGGGGLRGRCVFGSRHYGFLIVLFTPFNIIFGTILIWLLKLSCKFDC